MSASEEKINSYVLIILFFIHGLKLISMASFTRINKFKP